MSRHVISGDRLKSDRVVGRCFGVLVVISGGVKKRDGVEDR